MNPVFRQPPSTRATSLPKTAIRLRGRRMAAATALALLVAACGTKPPARPADEVRPVSSSLPRLETHPIGPSVSREGSLWTPVPWSDLPGLDTDDISAAWPAWVRSCERPPAGWAQACAQVRELLLASDADKRAWLRAALQPYLVRKSDGNAVGLLTAYYEPLMQASRLPGNGYGVPLYRLPDGFNGRGAWHTRQQIESASGVQALLRGREIAWLQNPVDAMVLHIQGSGRLNVQEPGGEMTQVRVAFAGTNNQPYRSIGRWLLERRLITDATWPGIKAWVESASPGQVQEMLWSNPRYVFFQEQALPPHEQNNGPRGAQGVPLTPGRSIAVDRRSIPYGTPVWLVTAGATLNEQRLVLAQDTGSAITGAVRADYFAGWGEAAGDLAGRVKQDLYLWTLWPKGAAVP